MQSLDGTASQVITVTIDGANDAPVGGKLPDGTDDPDYDATNGRYAITTPEDTPKSGTVKAFDVDGDTLGYTVDTQPTHGTLTLNSTTGAYTYTPAPDYHGPDSFVVEVSDGNGGTVLVTVDVTVTPDNDAPVGGKLPDGTDDPDYDGTNGRYAITTPEDTPKSGTVKAFDVDGDTLGYTVDTQPTHGTLTLNSTTGAYTYTPAPDYHGPDSFVVEVSDGNGGTVLVTVDVTVTPDNDAPVGGKLPDGTDDPDYDATNGRYAITTPEDTPKSGTVKAFDVDGDTLGYTVDTQPTHGTVTLNSTTGAYTYTPAPDYHGPDSFVVEVSDGNGGTVLVTVDVTVTPDNDAPVGGKLPDGTDDPDYDGTNGRYAISTPEDTPKSGSVRAFDVDGDTLGYTVDTQPTHGTVTLNSTTGAYTYTPAPDYHGPDSFVVEVSDGNGGTVLVTVDVTVTPDNDAPVGGKLPDGTDDPDYDGTNGRYEISTPEDTPKSGTVKAFDQDGDTLGYTVDTQPTHGTLTLNSTTGAYTYTPAPDYHGPDSFVVEVSDGNGGTVLVTVDVTVTPDNDAPVGGKLPDGTDDPDYDATNGRYAITTPEDTPKSGTVKAFDVDGDTLGYTVDTQPTHGTVTLNSTTGAYTYTPAPDYHGPDSFVVEVSDGNGGTVLVTVDVTVTPDNDAPIGGKLPDGTDDPDYDATNGRYAITTPEDTPKSGTVKAFDVDGDTLGYTVDTQPTHGTVTLNSTTGAYTYTPAPDYHGPDSFVVEVSDGNGGTVLVTVDITVTPDNDAPVGGKLPDGTDDPDYDGTNGRYAISTPEDTPKSGSVRAFDVDGDTLGYTVDTQPTHGTVTLNSTTGAYTYTPAPDYHGPDSFVVEVSDGNGGTVLVTVDVTVTPDNDAPVGGKLPDGTDDPDYDATNGRYAITTPEDTPKSGTVKAFDVDGDTLGYTVDTQPTHGTVTLNSTTGAYTYTPAPDYHGPDSFVVEVSDGNGGTVLVTVDVTVTPDNDAPIGGKLPDGTDDPDYDATNGRYAITTPEDTPKSGSVRAFDVDGDTLGYTVDTQPIHGTLTLDPATGAYTYTPAPDYHGPDSFVVEVSDGNGGTVLVTVDVTVTPDNDAPVGGKLPDGTDDPDYDATNGRYAISTPEDTPKSGTVKAFDQDGDTLGYTVDTQPTHGTLTLNSTTGAYTYTPAPDYHGPDSFVVEVSDGNGGTVLVTVDVTVTPDNDAPVGGKLPDGTDDPDFNGTNGRYEITTPQNTPQGGRVRGYDRDGDTLGYVVTSSPAHGTVSVAPLTGQYTFTPASGFVGTDSFVVTVSDGQGGTAQITVRVTVTPVVTPVPPVVPAPVVLPPPPPPAPAPVLVAPLPMAPVVLPEPPSAPVAPPVVPFDSVVRTPVTASPVSVAAPGLVALSSSPLNFAALADNRAAFSDLYTSRSGFPVVVFQLDRPSLTLYHGVSDQYADAGAVSSFTVPYDAFAHTDPSERITLSATQADGRPLPGWVRFDAESGRFDIETPRGVRGELAIKLSARDTQGREVSTLFRLSVGERQGNNGGRAGLGEQLRQAGQRTGAAVERAPAAASARAG